VGFSRFVTPRNVSTDEPRRRGRKPSRHNLRQRIERAADLYLEECYARRTAARVSELAQQLELTREHVTRTVSDSLGMSLLEFLRARQLRRAQHLLRTTSLSTVQIAAASGFGTTPAFYRSFKAAFRMTPGQYRSQITK
jgi:AraC-like DNA-binding protein